MRVAIHQPIYLPWIPYFEKMRDCDVFVILDHVRGKKGLNNSNVILTPNGPVSLTIPIKNNPHDTPLCEWEVADQKWRRKHIDLIRQNYRKAPGFRPCFDALEDLYSSDLHSFKSVYIYTTAILYKFFDLKTKILFSSDMKPEGHKSDLNLNICKELGATSYLSSQAGKEYLKLDEFEAAGIKVEWFENRFLPYPQRNPGFVPGLSAIDCLFNTGRLP